jgi:hypothetical protein
VGAYLGKAGQQLLAPWISEEILMVASIILTIIVTVVLLKVDISEIARKVVKKKVLRRLWFISKVFTSKKSF